MTDVGAAYLNGLEIDVGREIVWLVVKDVGMVCVEWQIASHKKATRRSLNHCCSELGMCFEHRLQF